MQKKQLIIKAFAAVLLSASICGCSSTPKGYTDYTIQKEQYFVEYSDAYDYWDVLTIEYPCLGGDSEQVETINKLFYDTAMEQANYWHFSPDDEVKALQEKYKIFSSDVRCDIPYHSQYLVSAHFEEIYAPISPVYYIHMTERAANADLLTGENYQLSDIFEVNEDFVGLWCEQVSKSGAYGDLIVNDEETRKTFLSWFLNEDEETAANYRLTPFFYMDGNKDFVIGISYSPKAGIVTGNMSMENSYAVQIDSELLESYRTGSEFWERYEHSESTGEVLECKDLKENLWLGKDAGVWEYLKR